MAMDREPGGSPDGPLFSTRRTRHRSPFPPAFWIGLVVVGVVVAGAAWFWMRSRQATDPPTPAVTDPAQVDLRAAPADVPEEPFVLPTLGASDMVVRELLARLSSHPRLAAWLVSDDLVRRFVEAVVDVSRGSSPVPALEMLIPEEPFSVEPSGGRLIMSPRSQRRYDLLGEVFASVDAERAARVYHQLLPLFLEAYQELGISDGPFEEVLARAVGNLLQVQVPPGPFEVREAVDRYVFTDEGIESLTPAQKHLYRLGPENGRRVQDKLREISDELGLTGNGGHTQ
jgi:hypothetical protein